MTEKLHINRGYTPKEDKRNTKSKLSWRIPQKGAMMKTKRLLNSHMDIKVLRALEQVAMPMCHVHGWARDKARSYILELRLAWQVIHTMRGNESNEAESHFIPIVVE